MRWWVCAAVVAAFLHGPTASAQVTEDLVFCSKLNNSRERLACYDAAARLQRQSTNRVATPKQSSSLPALVPAPPAASSVGPDLTGPYAAIIGGYAAGKRAPADHFSDLLTGSGTVGALADPLSISGPSVGVGVGYNIQHGNLVIGFEARGRIDFADTKNVGTTVYDRPLPVLLGTCSGCGPIAYTASAIDLHYELVKSDRIQRLFSGDVGARFGFVVGDWLPYARIGAGVVRMRETFVTDQSKRVICVNPTIVSTLVGAGFNYRYDAVACASVASGPAAVKTTREFQLPYLTFGLGLERSMGPLFGRLEAELSTYLPGPNLSHFSQVTYGGQVSAALGYRF